MVQDRNIIKYGALQETIRKKEGTLLLRKKKVFYEPEQFVAFCVHNGKIPLLEWYESKDKVFDHEPLKVRDLLDCMYVDSVLGDDRGFIIGLSDKLSALEFCASNSAECSEWMSSLTTTLRELECLGETENLYAEFSQPPPTSPKPIMVTNSRSSPASNNDNLSSSILSPILPLNSGRNICANSPLISSPPLPPRPNNVTLTRSRTLLTDQIPMQSTSHSSPYTNTNAVQNDYTTNIKTSGGAKLRKNSSLSDPTPTNETESRNDSNNTTESLGETTRDEKPTAEPIETFRQLTSPAPLQSQPSLSAADLPQASTTSAAVSNPLRIISRRIQMQHQLHLSVDQQSLMGVASEDSLPPLPPRKSQQQQRHSGGMPTSPISGNSISSPTKEEKPDTRTLNVVDDREMYDMGGGNKEVVGSQYDSLSPPSESRNMNYDLLTVKKDASSNHVYNQLSGNTATLSDITSSSSRTYSEEASASSSSCKMRLSSVSSPVESSRASTSSESRRSAMDAHPSVTSPHLPPLPLDPTAAIYDMTSGAEMAISKKQEQYDFPSSPPLPSFTNTFREALSKPRLVPLLLTICVENIAFVEVGGKVWIAGWTVDRDIPLKDTIHFGDEVVQVGNELVKGIDQFPAIFYRQSTPGVPINIQVRSIPNGSVYSLVKPLNPKKSMGIALHKKKNRIALIEEKSAAWLAQVPIKVDPYVYGSSKEVASVITEVDGIPLNPFANNEQFFHRLEKLAQGASFAIIIHPRDFVKLVREQMKTIKGYKRFSHAS